MNGIYLELHVPDFAPAKEFYQKLGFSIVWERKPDGHKGYVVMKHDGSILCFWAGNEEVYTQSYFKQFPNDTPRGYGVEIVYTVPNIEEYFEKVKTFATVSQSLEVRPWGLRDFRIIDPFGYYIRVSEEHDIRDKRFAVP
jgi:lactoylglutathione lyase